MSKTFKFKYGLLVLSLICGCSKGSNIGEVYGKVTYQGQPVRFAKVEFRPVAGGKSSLGWTNEQGEYVAQYTLSETGALVGMHKVILNAYDQEGQPAPPVPAEYSGKAGKEFEVKAGSNQLDISF
jgi:hypothetical protein